MELWLQWNPKPTAQRSLLPMRCYKDYRWEDSSAPHSYWWVGTQTEQEPSSQPARSKHWQEKALWIRATVSPSRRWLSKQTIHEGAVFRKEITTEFDVSTGFIIFTDTIPWKWKKKSRVPAWNLQQNKIWTGLAQGHVSWPGDSLTGISRGWIKTDWKWTSITSKSYSSITFSHEWLPIHRWWHFLFPQIRVTCVKTS